jgi:hypothetical protein
VEDQFFSAQSLEISLATVATRFYLCISAKWERDIFLNFYWFPLASAGAPVLSLAD